MSLLWTTGPRSNENIATSLGLSRSFEQKYSLSYNVRTQVPRNQASPNTGTGHFTTTAVTLKYSDVVLFPTVDELQTVYTMIIM